MPQQDGPFMPNPTFSGKAAVDSKTLVFNVLTLIVGVAIGFGFQDFQADPNIEPLSQGVIALIQILLPLIGPVVNIGLRLATRQPIVRFFR
jgi:Na+/H+-dicarboxylate symporter